MCYHFFDQGFHLSDFPFQHPLHHTFLSGQKPGVLGGEPHGCFLLAILFHRYRLLCRQPVCRMCITVFWLSAVDKICQKPPEDLSFSAKMP